MAISLPTNASFRPLFFSLLYMPLLKFCNQSQFRIGSCNHNWSNRKDRVNFTSRIAYLLITFGKKIFARYYSCILEQQLFFKNACLVSRVRPKNCTIVYIISQRL